MKRLNPETGMPYRFRERRNDGKYFLQYDTTRLQKNGYFYERWGTEEMLQSWIDRFRKHSKRQSERYKKIGKLNLERRVNPNTGKPFQIGDIEDGKYFIGYELRQKSKDDRYFREKWTSTAGYSEFEIRRESERYRLSRVLQKAKERANANNAEFDLTEDWIWSRFETGKCEATGISFSFDQTDDERRNPFAPSVDRIDNNNKNYTMDNCRLVVSAFNIMRADWSDETLKILNKGFSNYLKSLDA